MTEFSVDQLPSKGKAYNVKTVSIDKFKMPQIFKMSQASALNTLSPMVSAISECLNLEPGALTTGDMYYFLAWERCNAYSEPMKAKWTCRGELYRDISSGKMYRKDEIVELVENYSSAEDKSDLIDPDTIDMEKVTCSAKNNSPISISDFEITYLPDADLDPDLDYPRAILLPDVVEMRKDPSIGQVAVVAQWVKEGKTLADKIEVLNSQSDLSLFERALKAEQTLRHGIQNSVVKKCPVCGTGSTHVVDINPKTFFLV